ncbi:hypothetical protein Egran_06811 [Elaphomyces granulatus]|uniref:NAD-dependent epimerase/dehydratase domain-containing protein n=1 Tax=Elaphomyces granulatus TaxID=519963 RepID=A0A232LMN9_9EURO|nr:hypothetical protein Egran_06811 [Elaphomyces granulatus]
MDPQKEGTGKHVLLTGANGFVATHILADLLDRDYSVTATVRSESKAEIMLKGHPSWKTKVNFQYVPDITTDGAFDQVFKEGRPFDYIIHAASPVNLEVEDIQGSLINPAVRGTNSILKSANKYGGPTLRRFVLLASAVGILNSFEDLSKPGKPYTEKDWNPVTAAQAIEKKDPVLGYNVSKKLAEKAAWDFMHNNETGFDLTAICPDIIIGPMIHTMFGPKSVNVTNRFAIYNFIDGTHKKIDGVTFPFWHYVDVRDVARAHVDSLTNQAASGQRIILVSDLLTPQLVVNVIRKNFPELRSRVPEGNPSQILPTGIQPTGWDTRVSLNILSKGSKSKSWKYIDLETCVVDAVKSMIDADVISRKS